MSVYHMPVLLKESVDALNIDKSGFYVDATLGGGGHAREILSRLGKNGKLMVFDIDSDAIKNAPKDERVIAVHNNFRFINNFMRYFGFDAADGIIADLGVSSHQFDTAERGFSFRFDTDIDMRMNVLSDKSAKEIINGYREEELARIFRLYGELSNGRKAAKLICEARKLKPIESTGELHNALKKILPPTAEHKFLAKIYQALRIEVNGEMRSLEYFLKGACKSLRPGGVLSIITYHSLEDRMVKNFLRRGDINGMAENEIYGKAESQMEVLTKKPITPKEEEIRNNTRARSAKLRIGKKKKV